MPLAAWWHAVLLGNWEVICSAGARPSSHTAATEDAGRREPCARCSGRGQEYLDGEGLVPEPLCPGYHGPACSGLLSRQRGTSHASGCLVASAPAWHTWEAMPRGQRQAWLFLPDRNGRGEMP